MDEPELRLARIPPGSEELLREIVDARAPDLLPVLAFGSEMRVTEAQRDRLQDALGDELMDTGFEGENYKLTNRGSGVDRLITAFSNAQTPTQNKRAARRSALFAVTFVLVVLVITVWLSIRNVI